MVTYSWQMSATFACNTLFGLREVVRQATFWVVSEANDAPL